MEIDSQDLVVAARGGSEAAFHQIVQRHSRKVFQLCWRITRDHMLAEDAAQEAFYKAWRGLAEFDGRSGFATWLHRIAVNAALEQLRRNARHQDGRQQSAPAQDASADDPFLEAAESELPTPQDHLVASALQGRVVQELEQMSAMERTAFVLKHVEGASLEDIAQTLSLNIGQSKQAVFRAVRKLRSALVDWR
ncbi:RNA polymerase sigma factor [Pseudomarimonas arenosa]|uniref:Sigma-70 family RNA polymerase sigma factor n=1 Tax=Pseudomarimonas arenosa TaxID=2774145 RepID=A0AAW3ZLV9_9GAMM|nr:sigma-70 family RNA polymerase sigma factor [Pseudomarimonas arenosa]MBD8526167.1 sigma-70 family RNA polymerase sigma factor [Pseudomarimonas arenosa]